MTDVHHMHWQSASEDGSESASSAGSAAANEQADAPSPSASSRQAQAPEAVAAPADDAPEMVCVECAGDLSASEKMAIGDFERGVIADEQHFIMYGMCVLCNEMAHPNHHNKSRHCDNVRVYNSTLRCLLALSSVRTDERRGRRSTIVQFLSETLSPPVSDRWWRKASQYLMGDATVVPLLKPHLRDPSPAPTPPSLSCVVCMTGLRRIMFAPCNHVLCCASCSNQITTCPLCRTFIESRTVVYLS